MDLPTWINMLMMVGTVVAAGFAGVALHSSRRSARAAEQQTEIARRAERAAARAARAAEEQTKIQRQLRIDAAQPYVWADLQPDDAQGQLIRLVVGNSGPTLATNVRVEIDPPLEPGGDHFRERTDAAQLALAAGIKSLAPGRKHGWYLGLGWDVIKDDGPVYTFTVNADGPFGPVPTLTYVVDLSQWRETVDMPGGTLHLLTQSVNKLAEKVVAVQEKQIAAAQARQRLAETHQRAGGGNVGEPAEATGSPDSPILDASILGSGVAHQLDGKPTTPEA